MTLDTTSNSRQRVLPVVAGKPDTLLSADRLNDLAKAIGAFANIKGGRNVTRILQRGFRWRDVEPGATRTCFSKELRDELFAAVNGLARTTGEPAFRFVVANGNVILVAGDGQGGTQIVEPPKDNEHLLEANVANRLIDAVNRVWKCGESGHIKLVKAEAGWVVYSALASDGAFCTYDPGYDHISIPQWEVINGTLDLIGRREPDGPEIDDFIPGSGMYWDLAGTTEPQNGVLQCINPLALTLGHNYEVGFSMAGNHREHGEAGEYISAVRVSSYVAGINELLDETFEPSWNDGWTQLIYNFTAPSSINVWLNFRQLTRRHPRYGNLIDDVWVRDLTTGKVLLSDDFDGRYVCATGKPWDSQDFIP